MADTTLAEAAAGALEPEFLDELRRGFAADPLRRVALNAVTQAGIDAVALDRRVATTTHHSFSHLLDDWAVTNQKASGRCWMFAGLNLLRPAAMRAMNVKDFEFSQNFTLFWDKFERANYFLEAILETRDAPLDDRAVAFLLERPLDDGGQWNMFVNLLRKHGAVPKAAMPETASSSSTGRMNQHLVAMLRQGARDLRAADPADAPAAKQAVLRAVWSILCIHLGEPPERFHWQWNDKDRQFTREGEMTPLEFAERFIRAPLEEYACLVHDPRPSNPPGRTYTVRFLGNIVGGARVVYLNVPIGVLKDAAMRTIMDGEPVWMGCDVGKMMHNDLGLWDAKLYDYEALYGAEFDLTKAERLTHHQAQMTHAMLFTGVDVVEEHGRPVTRRWRVENSWGDDKGQKGFYAMNDNWFDEHMFEIAVHKRYLPDDLAAALDRDPVVLPPWDPMGALARG